MHVGAILQLPLPRGEFAQPVTPADAQAPMAAVVVTHLGTGVVGAAAQVQDIDAVVRDVAIDLQIETQSFAGNDGKPCAPAKPRRARGWRCPELPSKRQG